MSLTWLALWELLMLDYCLWFSVFIDSCWVRCTGRKKGPDFWLKQPHPVCCVCVCYSSKSINATAIHWSWGRKQTYSILTGCQINCLVWWLLHQKLKQSVSSLFKNEAVFINTIIKLVDVPCWKRSVKSCHYLNKTELSFITYQCSWKWLIQTSEGWTCYRVLLN